MKMSQNYITTTELIRYKYGYHLYGHDLQVIADIESPKTICADLMGGSVIESEISINVKIDGDRCCYNCDNMKLKIYCNIDTEECTRKSDLTLIDMYLQKYIENRLPMLIVSIIDISQEVNDVIPNIDEKFKASKIISDTVEKEFKVGLMESNKHMEILVSHGIGYDVIERLQTYVRSFDEPALFHLNTNNTDHTIDELDDDVDSSDVDGFIGYAPYESTETADDFEEVDEFEESSADIPIPPIPPVVPDIQI